MSSKVIGYCPMCRKDSVPLVKRLCKPCTIISAQQTAKMERMDREAAAETARLSVKRRIVGHATKSRAPNRRPRARAKAKSQEPAPKHVCWNMMFQRRDGKAWGTPKKAAGTTWRYPKVRRTSNYVHVLMYEFRRHQRGFTAVRNLR